MKRCRIGTLDDLWSGEVTALRAGDVDLVVVRHRDGVYAYRDRCAHLGFPLSRGTLHGHVLTCSAHHWQYDIRTGKGINPAGAGLAPVAVTVEDGQLYALLE